jgi:hypothetical protein
MKYTTLNMYQSMPTTCNQPVPNFFRNFLQICDSSILQHAGIFASLNYNSWMFATLFTTTRRLLVTLSSSLLFPLSIVTVEPDTETHHCNLSVGP